VGIAFLLFGVVAAAFAVGRVLAAPRASRVQEDEGASR
jgi:hypothetical protein